MAGSSLGDICRLFNDVGAYGLTGKPWTPSTVSLFLRASRNAGLRSHNGEIVGDGLWPSLVEDSTWRTAQTVLDAPRRKPGPKSVRQHALTGVMLCGKPSCGGRLAGNWTMHRTGGKPGRPKQGERKTHPGERAHSIVYACRTCHGVSIRAEHVEPLLYRVVGGRLAMDDAADLINADIAELERKQQDQERLRVFEGILLGTPQAVDAVKQLSADRFRAVLGVLAVITVSAVGKGGNTFDPDRVQFHRHQPEGKAS